MTTRSGVNGRETAVDKPTGAEIIALIRDGRATDWSSLCRCLGVDPKRRDTISFWIAEALQDLVTSGFIEVQGELDAPALVFPEGPIRLLPAATFLVRSLGISIREAAKIKNGRSLVIEPFFGVSDDYRSDHCDYCMLMPFAEDLLPVYNDHIKPVVSAMSLTIKRADDLFSTHEVMKDVWQLITKSTAVIAECTGRNPNVFYEIGIAHTLGKPVILITQNEDDVPFDLRAISYIKYKYTPPGMKIFEDKLRLTIRAIERQR